MYMGTDAKEHMTEPPPADPAVEDDRRAWSIVILAELEADADLTA
jgi:hypothetical protein